MRVNVTLYGGGAGFTSCQGGRGDDHPLPFLGFNSVCPSIISSKDLSCSIPFRFSAAFRPASHRAPRRLLWARLQPPRRSRLTLFFPLPSVRFNFIAGKIVLCYLPATTLASIRVVLAGIFTPLLNPLRRRPFANIHERFRQSRIAGLDLGTFPFL